MTPNEYQEATLRTLRPDTYTQLLTMGGLGISGEAGEVTDLIKKIVFHGHEFDQKMMCKELGDVCWYVATVAWVCGITFETVLLENIAKLQARYPTGFSEQHSQNRSSGDL